MRLSPWWRLAVASLAAVAMGLASLMVSERIGRLSMDLQYDDVTYAVDAAERNDAWTSGGAPALLRSLLDAPTRSPYSTLVGLAAFRVLGVHDLSLYVANLAVLLAAAGLATWLTRERSDATFLVALVLVVPSALCFHSQTEFRPDPAYGLCVAAMFALFASAALDERPRRALGAGVMLGLCLVVKPTFFAHSLALALMLAAIAVVAHWRRSPEALRPLGLPFRRVAGFLAVGVLVTLPYYATAAAAIFEYFWSNTFGTYGRVHNLREGLSPLEVLQSFEPFLFQFGRYHPYACAAVAVGLLPVLALRRLPREALRTALLLLGAFASAAIIVAGRQPNPFFFASAAWLSVFAVVAGFGALAGSFRPRASLVACGIAAILIVPLTVSSLRNLQASWPPGARHGSSENVRLLAAMRDDLRKLGVVEPVPGLNVLVDSSGPVNPMVLRWVARLNGMRVQGEETHLVNEARILEARAAESDYVIAIRPDRASFDQWLPLKSAQGPFYDWAWKAPGLEVISGDAASTYVLLANRASTARFGRR